MAEPKETRRPGPGLYDRSAASGVSAIEAAASIATLVWLLIAGGYFLFSFGTSSDSLLFLLTVMVIVLPIALIWVAAITIRSSRVMRSESARLAAAIDAIRQAYVTQAQNGQSTAPHPALLSRLDEIAGTQRNFEATLAMLGGVRQAETAQAQLTSNVAPSEADDEQPTLSLGTSAEDMAAPLATEDFIRALHFPETAEDTEGFSALRRALKDRQTAKLIQAAQDVLTLLSQDGIYMDDLRPDLARPEIWRAFAQGTRGREIAALGGVRDRSSLALAAGRMKQDPIFRDAAHHFLRRFDTNYTIFEQNASDAEISAFAGTRTARAFMLLGRIAGTFD